MTSVNNVSTGDSQSILDSINKRKDATQSANAGQQSQFLTLMMAQMKNQNPLDPTNGTEFLSQLAQFNTVDGISKLNTSMSDMATSYRSTQALQATALVGRSVQVPGDTSALAATGSLTGSIDLPASTNNLNVNIYKNSGELVNTITMGSQEAGNVPFNWNGKDANGNRMAAGNYRAEAIASQAGKATTLKTYVNSNVDSVTVSASGSVSLNVAGQGAVTLDAIKQIN
jgi:flagellar basal-body rod modification protein FlgD